MIQYNFNIQNNNYKEDKEELLVEIYNKIIQNIFVFSYFIYFDNYYSINHMLNDIRNKNEKNIFLYRDYKDSIENNFYDEYKINYKYNETELHTFFVKLNNDIVKIYNKDSIYEVYNIIKQFYEYYEEFIQYIYKQLEILLDKKKDDKQRWLEVKELQRNFWKGKTNEKYLNSEKYLANIINISNKIQEQILNNNNNDNLSYIFRPFNYEFKILLTDVNDTSFIIQDINILKSNEITFLISINLAELLFLYKNLSNSLIILIQVISVKEKINFFLDKMYIFYETIQNKKINNIINKLNINDNNDNNNDVEMHTNLDMSIIMDYKLATQTFFQEMFFQNYFSKEEKETKEIKNIKIKDILLNNIAIKDEFNHYIIVKNKYIQYKFYLFSTKNIIYAQKFFVINNFGKYQDENNNKEINKYDYVYNIYDNSIDFLTYKTIDDFLEKINKYNYRCNLNYSSGQNLNNLSENNFNFQSGNIIIPYLNNLNELSGIDFNEFINEKYIKFPYIFFSVFTFNIKAMNYYFQIFPYNIGITDSYLNNILHFMCIYIAYKSEYYYSEIYQYDLLNDISCFQLFCDEIKKQNLNYFNINNNESKKIDKIKDKNLLLIYKFNIYKQTPLCIFFDFIKYKIVFILNLYVNKIEEKGYDKKDKTISFFSNKKFFKGKSKEEIIDIIEKIKTCNNYIIYEYFTKNLKDKHHNINDIIEKKNTNNNKIQIYNILDIFFKYNYYQHNLDNIEKDSNYTNFNDDGDDKKYYGFYNKKNFINIIYKYIKILIDTFNISDEDYINVSKYK